eukprot:1928891-Amphidinium_carterae.1
MIFVNDHTCVKNEHQQNSACVAIIAYVFPFALKWWRLGSLKRKASFRFVSPSRFEVDTKHLPALELSSNKSAGIS